MSDKPEKKAPAGGEKKDAGKGAPAPAVSEAKPTGGGLLTKTPILIGGAMFLEAIVLFGGFKFIAGGAKNANAADLTTPEVRKTGGADGDKTGAAPDADASKTVEMELVSAQFPNKQSGRMALYDVRIVVEVKTENADKVKKLIADHDALIKDRVRTIMAESDPDKLGGGSEPGLETLRRQVKFQLEEVLGDGLVDEVLVPQCTQLPVAY